MGIQELKNGLAHIDSELSNVRSDVNESKSAIVRLDQRVDDTAASLAATRIEVASNRGTCLKMKEEATQRDDEIGKLRLELEKLKGRMNEHLEDKIHQLDIWVEELLQEHGATKITLINQKESLQMMGCELKGVQEVLNKLTSDQKRLVKHLNEMDNKLDGTEANLSRSNTNYQNLQVDHDASKTNTQILQVDLQGLATKLQKLTDDHLKCFKNVGIIRQGMEKVSGYHDETRELLNRTVSDVKELQEAHGNSNATMLTLHKNLERVHGIASSAEEDLKLTNVLRLSRTGHNRKVDKPHHLNRI